MMKAGQITKEMEEYFEGYADECDRKREGSMKIVEETINVPSEKKNQIVRFVRRIELEKSK